MKVDHRDVVEVLSRIRIDADPVHLSKLYGYRFNRAWETVREGRVKKYVFKPNGRVVWIVVGRDREYLIYPIVGYCSCDDFYFSVIDRVVPLCHHLIAVKLAQVLGRFEVIEEDDGLYGSLLKEWTRVDTEQEALL